MKTVARMPYPASHQASRLSMPRIATSAVFTIVIVIVLVGVDILAFTIKNPALIFGHHYYLALGDSISFGYQPDYNFTSGFADDVFADLKKANVTDLVNYACAGESTTTMIQGNCQLHLIHHDAYTGPQLAAAVSFLKRHSGHVDPVTLAIGSNDVLQDFDQATCTASSSANDDVARMDGDLTQTILPQLRNAMGSAYQKGDLVMLNYYNPFARACPDSATFVRRFNQHLADDAAAFGIPIVDVYTAFGGDAHTADNLCTYTWICSAYHDIHPTTAGYRVIADAVENTLAYPGVGDGAPIPLPALGR